MRPMTVETISTFFLRGWSIRTLSAQSCGAVIIKVRIAESTPTQKLEFVNSLTNAGTTTNGSKNAKPIEKNTKSPVRARKLRIVERCCAVLGNEKSSLGMSIHLGIRILSRQEKSSVSIYVNTIIVNADMSSGSLHLPLRSFMVQQHHLLTTKGLRRATDYQRT